jgi:hypothetical protein
VKVRARLSDTTITATVGNDRWKPVHILGLVAAAIFDLADIRHHHNASIVEDCT